MDCRYQNKIKVSVSVLVCILALILSGCALDSPSSSNSFDPEAIVKINDHSLTVELAQTPKAKYRGLSGRQGLCDNCGMLFVFPEAQKRAFVMRDMKFPLDIIWLRDKKVVGINKDLPPNGEKYLSPTTTDSVLEVEGGFCDRNNIQTGDKIKITK